MKKFLKILGIILGVIVLAIASVAAWVNFSGPTVYPAQTIDIVPKTDSLSLAKGQKMAETICAYCHRGDNGTLEGKLFAKADSPFGEIWTGNITRHPTKGLGRYSDGELAYLLRTGVKRDGHFAGPFMPFVNLSDDDLAALIGYLRSDAPTLAPSEAEHTTQYSFLAKALFKLGAIEPLPYAGQPIEAPAETEGPAYGRYLATAVYQCYDCHSASFEANDPFQPENSPHYFGGGNHCEDLDFNIVLSRNITPHPEEGIGNWDFDQFRRAVMSGMRPDGSALSVAMPRFALLDSNEVRAIWDYLQTVPPLESSPTVAAQ